MKKRTAAIGGVFMLVVLSIGGLVLYLQKPTSAPSVAGVVSQENNLPGSGFSNLLGKREASEATSAAPEASSIQTQTLPATSSLNDPVIPQQTTQPKVKPTPKPTVIPGTPLPVPTDDPYALAKPDSLKAESATMNVSKGTFSFTVKADWGERDEQLVWANYNGTGLHNMFYIVGSGRILVFDTYDKDGEVIGECNVDLDNTSVGIEYVLKFEWDFGAPATKKVYVNDELAQTCHPSRTPEQMTGNIFTGEISGFTSAP